MKQISYIFAFLLALLCGAGAANADTVSPYKMDFNTEISTSAHDFRVAMGWGHLVESNSSGRSSYYVDYTYSSTDGVDGTGALKVGSQSLGSSWNPKTVNDLLITPPVTGAVSVYVKQASSSGTVKFYTVTKSGSTYKRGSEITLETTPTLSTSEYVKVELPAQAEGTLVGIRGENVYLDDFEAASAVVEPYMAITLTSVTNLNGDSPDCNADGMFPVKFEVVYKNDGEADLTPGMEGYVLAVVHSSDTVAVATLTPTKTLAVGETATDTIEGLVDYATYPSRARYDVMEYVSGTTKYGAWLEPVAYAPAMQLRYDGGRMDSGASYSYGMTTEAVSKSFTIRSNGAAPLTVTAITVPEGFTQNLDTPFTLAAHKDTVVTVTLGNETPGIYSGDVTVKADGVDDFTFGVSGTVLDSSKYFESFATEATPAGMILESNWTVSQRDYATGENPYMAVNNRQTEETKLITPLLKVTEGEKFSFDAARTGYYSSGDGVFLNVYYSPDRKTWTLVKHITSDELPSTKANSYKSMGALATFVVDGIPAGNWYVGFGAGYTCVDNIYGFELVDVAHDLLVTGTKMPATATVNTKYTATVKLKNLKGAAEAADSYTVSLYDGDKVVATAETPEIGASSEETFTLSYVPHTAGTTTLYAEFKSGDYTLKTDETEVAVAEEQAVTPLVVGDGSSNVKRVVFDWYNADDSKGGLCDFYYPADMLTAYGLKAGDRISGFSFTGTPESAKTLSNVDMYAKYGMVTGDYTAFADTAALPTVQIMSAETAELVKGEAYKTDINLTEPLVWDGTSAVRLFTYVKGSSYAHVAYPVDGSYKTCSARGASSSYVTTSNTPVATFNIKLDPKTYAGTVKCGDTPVEGAAVTLRSDDDVIYTDTTAADGTFSMAVMQSDKTYTLTVSADNCYDYVEENVTVDGGDPVNITLNKKTAGVSGKVTFRGAGLKGATVTLVHKGDVETDRYETATGEDGKFAFVEVPCGYKYSVEVSADKFVSYASADSVEVLDDTVLDDIALTKPAFAVTATVAWGETPLAGVKIECKYTDKDQKECVNTYYTDNSGKCVVENLDAEYVYTFAATDENGEFDITTAPVVVEDGEDFAASFVAEAKPVTVSVESDGYMTYSYKRALDFSGVSGVEAYAVTAVKTNYTELTPLTKVAANTGVLLKANAGTYTVMPIEKADDAEGNLLVATAEDYTITADNVGKAWALTRSGGMDVFKSVAGTTVAKGGAYLGYESSESVIYLSQTDGISAAGASSAGGAVDYTKPVYNLAGQQVGKDYKGVVIQNGKKFSVK